MDRQLGERLHLEDLTPGMTFTSRAVPLTAEMIKAFAHDYDPQPFHLDEDAAKDSFFKGLAASGWHTAALSMRLMVECLPIAGGVIGAGVELSWPRPTRAGDSLTANIEIIDVTPSKSKPDRGMATVRNETRNGNGDVLQISTAKVLVWRRGAAPAPAG